MNRFYQISQSLFPGISSETYNSLAMKKPISTDLNPANIARVMEVPPSLQPEVYWRARTIAMHELDHLGDLERKGGQSDK